MQKLALSDLERKVWESITEDMESQFKDRNFDEIYYTINLHQLKKRTGVSSGSSSRIVRDFLEAVGKRYDHKGCDGGSFPKYMILIKKDEVKKWKDYVSCNVGSSA